MNKNEQFVITINRELGSGGRTVGRKLAGRLGVQYYDKALIEGLQNKFDLTAAEIERLKGQNHSWWAELKRALLSPDAGTADSYYSLNAGLSMVVPDVSNVKPTSEDIFITECELLKGIAEAESCVVAGRSGFHIFRNHPNHLSILIQASMPFRVARVVQKQEVSETEAVEIIERVDKMREHYVNKYAKTSRYDTRNYQLVLSADGKTEDQLVDIIMSYIA